MPVFANRMKDFTDHLRISIENRTDALGQVHNATNNLLSSARSFMGNVSHEHKVMAGELHEMLDQFHDDLTDRVENMRKRHRASLEETQAELRKRLHDNKTARNDSVDNMRRAFRKSRQEVADDLRAASHTWREFTAHRHEAKPDRPSAEPKAVVRTVERAAPQHGKTTRQTKENFGTKPKGRRT